MRTLRAVGAIVLYVLAAVGGLSVGYLATAPRTPEERERAAAVRQHRAELAEMEAAAAFLAEEERLSARPAGHAKAAL
jgi:hypothetical protein